METLKELPGWLLRQARYLYRRYPARVTTTAAAAIVVLGAKFGVVVEEQSLLQALAYALPILLGGKVIHDQVEPVRGVRKPRPLQRSAP